MIESLMWTEKYRPKELADLAMSEDNRAVVERSLEAGEIPHLLLHGPAGVGKTTLAFVIRDRLDCRALVLNASKERGIDVVRERIGGFVRGRFGARWNLVILDEADALTRDAQTALRNLMETHADVARFVLTANYPSKIIDPLRSRCVEMELAEMSVRDRAAVLVRVLKSEGVEVPDRAAVAGYAQAFTDLRRMLTAAQRSVLTHGELRPVGVVTSQDGVRVLRLIEDGDWSSLRDVAKDPSVDHAELLRAAFWAVPDEHERAAGLRATLATAYDETPTAPDPVVHFLGTCAGLMS